MTVVTPLSATPNPITGSGTISLPNVIIGSSNTAIGTGALSSNTGTGNTASGTFALQNNTAGLGNTATGFSALSSNNANNNTATGAFALQINDTGTDNTAFGQSALINNTAGSGNIAIGANAGNAQTTGSSNIYIGNLGVAAESAAIRIGNGIHTSAFMAGISGKTVGTGSAVFIDSTGKLGTAAGSNNIYVGNSGVAGDLNTIRIGTNGTQTRAFIAGISGTTVGVADAVFINSQGQLGTMLSSRRFKEEIHDMGEASSGLLRLRPVTFRYKEAYADGARPVQYGLIAEEVAEVHPDLVVYSSTGEVQTVQYHKLVPMLLNELQKQHRRVDALQAENAGLKARLEAVERVALSKEALAQK